MHFDTKNTLKNNRNYTSKQAIINQIEYNQLNCNITNYNVGSIVNTKKAL